MASSKTLHFTTMLNKNCNGGIRCSLPTFSEKVEAKLPAALQQLTNMFQTSDDKDAIVLSAIVTLSATLYNVCTTYGGDDVYPSLFACVVGQSGSNKGIMKFTRHLVTPIHRALLRNGVHFIIPENSSSAGFVQLLDDGNGIGLFTGTEIDSLLKTWKTGWGNFSADLRKAFHHEPITLYRKTYNEYVEIDCPRLSLLTSGTPDQFTGLFSGNAENGLYSRFLVMCKPSSGEWCDQFQSSKQSLKSVFTAAGEHYYEQWQKLMQKERIEVRFTPEQQNALNDYFSNQYRNYGLTMGEESRAFVERAAIKVVKVAMVLTVLRNMDSLPFREEMEVGSPDFEAAMEIVCTLMEHFTALYEIIPHAALVELPEFKTEEMRNFYETLPMEFTSMQFEKLAVNQGIPKSTAYRYIRNMVTSALVNHVAHGVYRKAA